MAASWAKTMQHGTVDPATVATAADLQDAMRRGAPHITITSHLDLTSLQTVEVEVDKRGGEAGEMGTALDAASGFGDAEGERALRLLLGNVRGPTLTVRGNCTDAPTPDFLTAATTGSSAPVLPLLPGQCLLLADSDALAVPEDTYVWLDGLYLRLVRTARSPPHPVLASIGSSDVFTGDKQLSGTLFMTAMAFQGDRVYEDAAAGGAGRGSSAGKTSAAGISHVHPEMVGSAETCRILVQGSVFANLGGSSTAAVSLVNVQASFVDCNFRANVAAGPDATVLSAGGSAAVRLQGCLFHGNAGGGQLLLDWTSQPTSSMSGYFSDEGAYESLAVAPESGEAGASGGPVCNCRAGAVEPMSLAEAPPVFLTDSDHWLMTMQNMLGQIPRGNVGADAQEGALEPNMLGACMAVAPGGHCRSELVAVTSPPGMYVEGAGGSSGSGLGGGAIAAINVAAVLVVAVVVAFIAYACRRRRQEHSSKASSTGTSDLRLKGELQMTGRNGGRSRRGDLSDGKPGDKGDSVSALAPSQARAAPLGIGPSQGMPRPAAEPADSQADGMNMLAFPALVRSTVGSTSNMPLLAGMHGLTTTADVTDGSVTGQDSSTIARTGGPEGAASALLMQSRSIESSLGRLSRVPTLADEAALTAPLRGGVGSTAAAAAAAAAPTPALSAAGRCASLPAVPGALCDLPAAAVQFHQRLFHPETHLGTLEQSNAFETVARSVGGTPALDPGDQASSSERLHFISSQLDSFGRRGIVLQKYELLGPDERRRGGQAVVQFVRAPQTNDVYAMKLFASRHVFLDEQRLYLNSGLASFMPTVVEFVDNEGGEFADAHGAAMPSLLVMEKGETLTERIHRCKHNLFTTIQILGQVGQCLAELHSRGWVHRDLKPGNIMFLPRRGTWTLIDFGLVARAGDSASVGFTLLYAAPEVIIAHAAGTPSMVVDPAVDAWALGVMAFELLTGRPAFNMFFLDAEEVQLQLRGEAELPWEGDRLAPDLRRRLGTLKGPVLGMLHRDPAQRWTCEQFWRALHAVFSGHTTS